MFPRRNFKILLTFLIFCSFLLIYSLSLITTKGIVVFSTNNIVDKLTASGARFPYQQQQQQHQHHQLQPSFLSLPDGSNSLHHSRIESQPPLLKQTYRDTLFRGDVAGGHKQSNSNLLSEAVQVVQAAGAGSEADVLKQAVESPQEQPQYQYNLNNMQNFGRALSPDGTLLKIPYKLVHLDLKGAPPKLSYLKSVLGTIKEAGGNGILLEYEDMFPYSGGGLNGTTHLFHYSQTDIADLISTANSLGLEIIPLVQTFGHLEFILKLERFRHLREVDAFPQEICPKNEVAWSLVTTLIDQVVQLHKDSQYIHIGCDEVYHIGECSRCHGKDTKELFLNHVKRVAAYVYEKHRKRSIIWDDMLRKFYVEELVASDIGNHVELMIWDYTEDVDRLVSPYLWPMYAQIFPNIWIASAFKGAFGETIYTVDVQRHALNHLSWLRVLSREQHRIKNLRGFVITGWSRYDHFAVLCELLPVAIPSMILSLQILVKQNMNDATKLLFKYLKCDAGNVLKLEDCSWSGADLYNSMRSLHFYEEQTKMLVAQHRSEKGWLSEYSLKHNYTSPWRLLEPMQMASQYLTSIRTYESSLQMSLRNYYEQHVVDEWMEQKVDPIIASLELMLKDCQSLSSRKSWERRPIVGTKSH